MSTRKEILEKLARGDITPEEAERLLDGQNEPDPGASGEQTAPPQAPPGQRRTGLAMGCLAAVIVSLIMAFLGLLLLFGFLFVARVSSSSRPPRFEEMPAGSSSAVPAVRPVPAPPPAMEPPPELPAPVAPSAPGAPAKAAKQPGAENAATEPAEPQDSDTQPSGGE